MLVQGLNTPGGGAMAIKQFVPLAVLFFSAGILFLPVIAADRVLCPVGLVSRFTLTTVLPDEVLQQYARGPGDAVHYFLPHHMHHWRTMQSGALPHWDPYSRAGHPFLAESEPGVLYPFKLLLLPLDALTAFSYISILHYLLCTTGMFVLLRLLAVRPLMATAGGIAFGLCGFFTAMTGMLSMTGAASWLPWLLAAHRLAMLRRTLAPAAAGAVLTAMPFLAGHTQVALYCVLALAVVAWTEALLRPRQRRLAVRAAALMLVGGILLAMPQLFPTALSFGDSDRASGDSIRTLPPAMLLLLFVPQAFGPPGQYTGPIGYVGGANFVGIVLPVFAAGALCCRDRRVAPYIVLLLLGGMFTFSRTFNEVVNAACPLLQSMHHLRARVLVQFALIVLGAVVIDRTRWQRSRYGLLLAAGAGVLIASVWLRHVPLVSLLQRLSPLLALTCLAWFVRRTYRERWCTAAAAVCIVAELTLYAVPHFSFAPRELFASAAGFPSRLRASIGQERIRQLGPLSDGPFCGETQLWHGLRGVDGFITFNSRSYEKFLVLLDGEDNETVYSPRFNRLLNVRYLVSRDTLPFPVIAAGPGGSNVYRDDSVMPRARLFYHALEATDDRALSLLCDPGFPCHTTLLLEPGVSRRHAVRPGTGSARILCDEAERIVIEVESTAPAWLYLSDKHHSCWEAEVDGKAVPVVRANTCFRAVPVMPGNSRVVMVFNPIHFRVGLLLMAGAAVWLLLVACSARLCQSETDKR